MLRVSLSTQSPITLCEIRHVERAERVYNRLSNGLNRALWLALMFSSLSITLFCVLLAAVDPAQYTTQPGERYLTITRILGVLVGVTFYIHFQVQVMTLGMAAESIARENEAAHGKVCSLQVWMRVRWCGENGLQWYG